MSRALRFAGALPLVVALVGCKGSDSAGSGPPLDDFDAEARDATATDSGRDAATDASNEAGDAGDAPTDSASEATDDAASDAPDDGAVDATLDTGPAIDPPVCPVTRTWATGTVLAISTPDDDVLAAVTPDELTIAWFSGAGSTGALHYADRAAVGDPFVETGTIADVPVDRVALSPDGLRIATVGADRRSVGERTRAARGSAFGASSEGPFDVLDGWLATQDSALLLGDLVLAANDTALFFSTYGTTETTTVRYSLRIFSNESWSAPGSASVPELAATALGRKRPTGIAADARTLFWLDTESSTEKLASRDGPIAPFAEFGDLGGRLYAQPNAACTRLYHSETRGASLDIVMAEAE